MCRRESRPCSWSRHYQKAGLPRYLTATWLTRSCIFATTGRQLDLIVDLHQCAVKDQQGGRRARAGMPAIATTGLHDQESLRARQVAERAFAPKKATAPSGARDDFRVRRLRSPPS